MSQVFTRFYLIALLFQAIHACFQAQLKGPCLNYLHLIITQVFAYV